jgi:transcriptional/translational regulatory protein YebC/TACO1
MYCDVSHLFTELGIIQTTKPDVTCSNLSEFEELCTDHAIEIGAEEVEDLDLANKSATVSFLLFLSLKSFDYFSTISSQFTCQPMELERIKRSLVGLGYNIENMEHVFIPKVGLLLLRILQDINRYKLSDPNSTLTGRTNSVQCV